jgi:hypothetical protein
MKTTVRLRVGTAAMALGFVIAAAPADAADTADEVKCQAGTSVRVGKFILKKMNCIGDCWADAFFGGDPADCSTPFGGATFGCVNSSVNSMTGSIQNVCNGDCPECYSGGDCSAEADTKIANAGAHVEALAADVFCDDSASGDGLTAFELKCQRVVAKAVTSFDARKHKCYSKCRKLEFKGAIPAGSCSPPATDPYIQECIAKLELKYATVIDDKCLDEPECGSYPVNAGAAWITAEEASVDAEHPTLFCND